jgi:hypothetical protein
VVRPERKSPGDPLEPGEDSITLIVPQRRKRFGEETAFVLVACPRIAPSHVSGTAGFVVSW